MLASQDKVARWAARRLRGVGLLVNKRAWHSRSVLADLSPSSVTPPEPVGRRWHHVISLGTDT